MRAKSNIDQAIPRDPEGMRRVFQDHLQSADGADIQIRSCEIDYVRQSSSRGVLQYTLELWSAESGQSVSQIVTAASFGGDRTQKQWSWLMRNDPNARKPIGPLALLPAVYVPELDLLLQVFPYDYRLPGLAPLLNGSSDLLAILLADAEFGYWEAEVWNAEVLRFRPNMRAMVRLDVEARQREPGGIATRRSYAKVYREPDEGRQAHRLHETLWERTRDGDAGFAVAQPIAYVDALQTLLMREATGDRLLQVVRRHSAVEAELAIRRTARAVAGLHQIALPEGLLPLARKEKRVQLGDVAEGLTRREPAHAAAIGELVSAIDQALDEPPLAPTHFDLKQGHIMLNGDHVAILDFDKMAIGNPLVDVAKLTATLGAEREGSQLRTERRAGLTNAFVDEYFAHAPAHWRAQFPANFALAALVEVGTTGRGRPKQDTRIGRVVTALTQAQRALAGELW